MFQNKRSRPLVVMTIISLFLIVPMATACADLLAVLVSTDTSGSVDGVDFNPEDIIGIYEVEDWFMFFDGSEYDLQTGKHDIEAFSIPYIFTDTLDSDSRTIYLSFYQNKVKVNGLGQVMGQDVVKFTETISPSQSYTYSRYFDGSDVGLSTVGEKIDGLDIWDEETLDFITEEIGSGPVLPCQAVLFISTLGAYAIPAKFTDGAGKLTGDGSDVLAFCATNLGEDTAGFWVGIFNGQEAGMPKNYIDSLAGYAEVFFTFTTPGPFAVDDAFGGHSAVYGYNDGFVGPEIDFQKIGLDAYVDGLHFGAFCDEECLEEIDGAG